MIVSRSRATGALACSVLALNAGCDSCGSKKPYTPFTIQSVAPLSATTAGPAVIPVASASAGELPKFAGQKEELAPPAAARWQQGDRELDAPPGRVFERAVRADFDGDGKDDVVAWTVPSDLDAGALPGELWYYPAAGPPRPLSPVPPFVPTGPGCKLHTTLAQTGPQTLTLDIAAECEARLVARSPVRALSVLRPSAEKPQLLTLRAAEPAADEVTTLGVDSSDADGDGRDDVTVAVTVQAKTSSKPATLKLAWLDRAAGISRDAAEPGQSLARAAGLEVTRSKGRSSSRTTAEAVNNLRRAYASVCAESGTARLFDEDGEPLRCGNLQSFVDRSVSAELNAALTHKDYVEALGVLSRDGFYHGKISEAARKSALKDLDKALPSVSVERALTLEAVPLPRTSAIRYSPLAFEPSGTLLVQTANGLVRVSSDGTRSEALSGESAPAPWPLDVLGEGALRWTGVTYACDRSEVLLVLSGPSAPPPPIVTDLLAPRPGSCRGGEPPRVAPPVALGFHDGAPEALVAGKRVGAKSNSTPSVPGSPRSPDGRYVVVSSPIALLVSGERSELWRISDASFVHAKASDCVVANGGSAVACVSDNRARLLLRP